MKPVRLFLLHEREIVARLDWEAERRRQVVARTRDEEDGEGVRPDPMLAGTSGRYPTPFRSPAVFRLNANQRRRMKGKGPAMRRAAARVTAVRELLAKGKREGLDDQVMAAWEEIKPSVIRLRKTGKTSDAAIAGRLVAPFADLQRKGIRIALNPEDLRPSPPANPSPRKATVRSGNSRGPAVCSVCRLELTSADRARRRSRHEHC